MHVLIAAALLAVATASGRVGLAGRGIGGLGRGYGGYAGGYGLGGYGTGYGYGGYGAVGRAVGVIGGRAGRGGHGGYANDYAEPRPYHYQYAVDDPNYGPMFNKEEQSDGSGTVQGSYAVNLPDGRTQYVKYVADHYNGFNAEVTYEGYANHPQVARGYGYGPAVGQGVVRAGAGLAGRRAVGYGTGLVGRRAVGYGAGLVGRTAGYGYTPVYRRH